MEMKNVDIELEANFIFVSHQKLGPERIFNKCMFVKLRENLDIFSFRNNLKPLTHLDSIWSNRENKFFSFEMSKPLTNLIFETQRKKYLLLPNTRKEKSFHTFEHQCALYLVLL